MNTKFDFCDKPHQLQGLILPGNTECMDMPILLPTGSKAIMTCSLQGIAMRQKPVHDRHSKIEVERESG